MNAAPRRALRSRRGPLRCRAGRGNRAVPGARGRAVLCLFLASGLPLQAAADPASAPGGAEVVHVAFSRSMFTGVNVSDARAAIQVWIDAVIRETGRDAPAETEILEGPDALRAGLAAGRIDGGAATSAEFLELQGAVPLAPIFIGTLGGRDREEYVLLVRQESAARSIADLAGRDVKIWENPRSCLVDGWLSGLLGGRPPETHFGSLQRDPKLSSVVLPVFFRQTEACLATRIGWETMSELNPQVGSQLRPLHSSPGFVAIVIFFRAGFSGPMKEALVAALRVMHETPRGRQVLTLFHGDTLKEVPPSALDTTQELLAGRGARSGVHGSAAAPPAKSAPSRSARSDRLAESTGQGGGR